MTNLKKSLIQIEVTTNENNIPERIQWDAKDGGVSNAEARAMILALWDAQS